MKRSRSLVFGLACGLLCMACVGLYIASVNEQAEAARADALARYGGDQVDACVAKRDVAAGETITEADVEVRQWVVDLLPPGALTAAQDVVGKQASVGILEGEVITEHRLGATEASIEVPDGLTAVSVPARDVQAVGGALAAGMRADVYAIGSTETAKLASQALIVATSASEGASSSKVSWITLAVTPSAVEELVSAAQNLDLYFVLPSEAGSANAEEDDATDEKPDKAPEDPSSAGGDAL